MIPESSGSGPSPKDPVVEPGSSGPTDEGVGSPGEAPHRGGVPGGPDAGEAEIIDLDLDRVEEPTVAAWTGAPMEEDEILDLGGGPEDGPALKAPAGDAGRDRADRLSLSSRGERDALLASVMRHDAERKEARSSMPHAGPKALGPQLLALALSTVVAVYVWFGSPSWASPDPVPPPPLSEEQTAVQAAVWLGAQQVESFQRRNGRVPGAQEVGSLPPGVRYERLDARSYILVGEGDRVAVSYSSGEPADALRAAAGRLLVGAESQ